MDGQLSASGLKTTVGIHTITSVMNLAERIKSNVGSKSAAKNEANIIQKIENLRFGLYITANVGVRNAMVSVQTAKSFYDKNYLNVR